MIPIYPRTTPSHVGTKTGSIGETVVRVSHKYHRYKLSAEYGDTIVSIHIMLLPEDQSAAQLIGIYGNRVKIRPQIFHQPKL
jgi:hypothetical protein